MVVQRFIPVHGVRRAPLGLVVTAPAVLAVGLPGAASGSAGVRGAARAAAGAGAVYGGVSARAGPS